MEEDMISVARLVLDLRPRDHVSSALRELHWLPIVQRIDYKLCLLVYKSSLGLAPAYINNMLTPAADVLPLSTLRAATKGNYVVPRTNRHIGNRAVSVAAPRAWKSVDRTQDSRLKNLFTGNFQNRLKTCLFPGLTQTVINFVSSLINQ